MQAYQEEQAEFVVKRSRSDTAGHLRELLASTKAKFGKRMASLFAARSLERASIPDEVIAKIAQEIAPVVVLQVMAALKEVSRHSRHPRERWAPGRWVRRSQTIHPCRS